MQFNSNSSKIVKSKVGLFVGALVAVNNFETVEGLQIATVLEGFREAAPADTVYQCYHTPEIYVPGGFIPTASQHATSDDFRARWTLWHTELKTLGTRASPARNQHGNFLVRYYTSRLPQGTIVKGIDSDSPHYNQYGRVLQDETDKMGRRMLLVQLGTYCAPNGTGSLGYFDGGHEQLKTELLDLKWNIVGKVHEEVSVASVPYHVALLLRIRKTTSTIAGERDLYKLPEPAVEEKPANEPLVEEAHEGKPASEGEPVNEPLVEAEQDKPADDNFKGVRNAYKHVRKAYKGFQGFVLNPIRTALNSLSKYKREVVVFDKVEVCYEESEQVQRGDIVNFTDILSDSYDLDHGVVLGKVGNKFCIQVGRAEEVIPVGVSAVGTTSHEFTPGSRIIFKSLSKVRTATGSVSQFKKIGAMPEPAN